MDASERRAVMVDRLVAEGTIRTAAVEAAMRAVPRHTFLGHVSERNAYADRAVPVKTDTSGTVISSVSQPTMVAAMLELLMLEAGHGVMEIGTGTGYNTALLAAIVGPDGAVTSIELDADLAASAEARLVGLGLNPDLDLDLDVDLVAVIDGDGAVGHEPHAPFDRIVVTTGAHSIAPAWADQLRDGGRLVAPVVDTDGMGLVRCLDKVGGALVERATLPCGFLVMRQPNP